MSLERTTQEKLADKHGVTQGFVSMAIRGERTSKRAITIKREYGELLLLHANAIVADVRKKAA